MAKSKKEITKEELITENKRLKDDLKEMVKFLEELVKEKKKLQEEIDEWHTIEENKLNYSNYKQFERLKKQRDQLKEQNEYWEKRYNTILEDHQKLLKETEAKTDSSLELAWKKREDNYLNSLQTNKDLIKKLIEEDNKISISEIAKNLNMTRQGIYKNKELIDLIKELKSVN